MENKELEVLGDLDYLIVLESLKEINFGLGKKMLCDFLRGKKTNSITKNRLYTLKNFGKLVLDEDEINAIIDNLILNGMIQIRSLENNRFMKLLNLTDKGELEINEPTLYKRRMSFNLKEQETKISIKDAEMFKEFDEFLYTFNIEQKKAIISDAKKILCIAGAGSGKTSVLTKRIEFLKKYRSIDPRKILAITFTRKAREEMTTRLNDIPELVGTRVETFNSFCEKILRENNDIIYKKPVRVIEYRDKIHIINQALERMNLSMNQAIKIYFEGFKKNETDIDHLTNIFLNDCFFIRDYFKFKNKMVSEEDFDIINNKNKQNIKMIVEICGFIEGYMRKYGLRDFADQLIDTLKFLEANNRHVPKIDYILVDEYQDVNSTQIKLLDILNPKNLFCVGDPRQSIYGWRGSDIRYILGFKQKNPDSEVITLTKNYRSTKKILDLINDSVSGMGFSELELGNLNLNDKGELDLLNFNSEKDEIDFVIEKIQEIKSNNSDIFVLARTNNQLNEIAKKFEENNLSFETKTGDIPNGNNNHAQNENRILLATIHAIKGMQAETVFIMGCTNNNFPCKGSEHPIVEMVKVEEYDKEEEERRLFYVAMSRTKKNLYLTYTGNKHTYFIKESMKNIINGKKNQKITNLLKESLVDLDRKNNDSDADNSLVEKIRSWRKEISKEQELPAYCIINNKTIDEIATKKPKSFEELSDIYGMGEIKIEKYGSQILRLVEENI